MKSVAYSLALLAALSIVPVAAHAETGPCTPTSTEPSYTVGDLAVFRTAHTLFVFREANGIPGIQRADTLHPRGLPDETCGAPHDPPVTGLYWGFTP